MRRGKLISLLYLALIFGWTAGTEDDDDFEYEEERESTANPIFLSKAEDLVVSSGETVTLPCQIDDLGALVVLWKNGTEVLFAGALKITRNPRVSLVPGIGMEIRDTRPTDSGTFTCLVSTSVPLKLHHNVMVLVPPSVVMVPDQESIEVEEGNPVTLRCEAQGTPTPQVFWRRTDDKLPSGEDELEGSSIVLPTVRRLDGGVYECRAENGVDLPATASITLDVLFAPKIEVDKEVVMTGVTYKTELICVIHAAPRATVTWKRNGRLLRAGNNLRITASGRRHTIAINSVKDNDLGTYTCTATNPLGVSQQDIIVTGLPGEIEVASNPQGEEPTSYELVWEVTSYSPVIEYELAFRRIYLGEEKEEPWTKVMIPAVTSSNPFHTKMYRIEGLTEAAIYESTLVTRNKYGWSRRSEPFDFSTRGAEFVQSPQDSSRSVPPSVANQKSNGHTLANLRFLGVICFVIICLLC